MICYWPPIPARVHISWIVLPGHAEGDVAIPSRVNDLDFEVVVGRAEGFASLGHPKLWERFSFSCVCNKLEEEHKQFVQSVFSKTKSAAQRLSTHCWYTFPLPYAVSWNADRAGSMGQRTISILICCHGPQALFACIWWSPLIWTMLPHARFRLTLFLLLTRIDGLPQNSIWKAIHLTQFFAHRSQKSSEIWKWLCFKKWA